MSDRPSFPRYHRSRQGPLFTPYPIIRRVRKRKEGNVLFNDALNTFYFTVIWLGHMAKDHSDSE